jgi:hypothetical protein
MKTKNPTQYEVLKHHRVVIVRNGEFVGLYRTAGEKMKLWRSINKKQYDKKSFIEKNKKPEEWGSGGHLGISGLWYCNELHTIPRKYNVHKKSHLKYLEGLLGGSFSEVKERINKGNPPA